MWTTCFVNWIVGSKSWKFPKLMVTQRSFSGESLKSAWISRSQKSGRTEYCRHALWVFDKSDTRTVVDLFPHSALLCLGLLTLLSPTPHVYSDLPSFFQYISSLPPHVYCQWSRPLLGKKWRVLHNSRPCYQDCWHNDPVKGAGYPADLGQPGLIFAGLKVTQGVSSLTMTFTTNTLSLPLWMTYLNKSVCVMS